MQKLFVSILTVALLLTTAGFALAQDEAVPTLINENRTASDEVALDETVEPEDLEVSEPGLLPDSPFYFLKNWSRAIRSAFTFDKVKKAELNLRYASEKLLEARALALKNKSGEILQKAVEKYEQSLDKIKETVDKIKNTASTNDKVDKFLDKYIKQETLHLKILDKLKDQVPDNVVEQIASTTDIHLEKFNEVMLKLEEKTQVGERLEKNLQELKGSDLKDIKNVEILKRIEEKLPEDAKEGVQKARERIMNRLEETLRSGTENVQEKFQQYLEEAKGEAENKIEILEDLRLRLQNNAQIRQQLEGTAEKVRERVREKIEVRAGKACPVDMINPNACAGRIVTEKDENGCPRIRCIELGDNSSIEPNSSSGAVSGNTGQTTTCINLWDPVCGTNGKTYSNKCYAEAYGIEIASQGACPAQSTETNQKQLRPIELKINVEAEPAE